MTARRLQRSLESTRQGLAALLDSLEHSGFKESVPRYQELRSVLIMQRIWCRDHNRRELDSLWKELGETARAIHSILAPFSEVMDSLKDLDRIRAVHGGVPRPVAQSSPGRGEGTEAEADDGTAELAELFLQGVAISNVALRRQLKWPGELRRSRLRQLTDSGALVRKGWGRSLSYRPAPDLRERLASDFTTCLETERA